MKESNNYMHSYSNMDRTDSYMQVHVNAWNRIEKLNIHIATPFFNPLCTNRYILLENSPPFPSPFSHLLHFIIVVVHYHSLPIIIFYLHIASYIYLATLTCIWLPCIELFTVWKFISTLLLSHALAIYSYIYSYMLVHSIAVCI